MKPACEIAGLRSPATGLEAVQRRGVRVTVVSTISTQPPMVAAELRRQADIFLDIVELQPKIGRDPAERAAREARERHTPQFLQHPTAPQPAGAGAPLDQARRSWQKACEILLAAADGLADVRAATRQVELALFQQAKWMAK